MIAVSQDDAPHASVVAFLDKLKIKNAAVRQDSKMALSGALGPDTVLPTTILYDAEGKEVWRYIGDLDWTGPEAAKLLAEGGVGKDTEQPPVDCGEAQRDQGQTREILRSQRFAEEQRPKERSRPAEPAA